MAKKEFNIKKFPKEVKNLSWMVFVVVASLGIWLIFSEGFILKELKNPLSLTGYFITEFANVFSNSPQIVFVAVVITVVVLLWIFSKKN